MIACWGCTGFYQYYSRHDAQVIKRKLQMQTFRHNFNASWDSHGLKSLLCEKHSETQEGKKITVFTQKYSFRGFLNTKG